MPRNDAPSAGWDALYRDLSDEYALYRPNDQLLEMLRRHLPDHPRPRVLEVGIGKGNESLELASAGGAVVGVDYSRVALTMLRRRAGGRSGGGLILVEADARGLPFRAGAFDLVFSQGVLEHFRDPLAVLREQGRVLRPGGVIVVEVPNRFSAYTLAKRLLRALGRWRAGWETEYSPGQLRALLESAGFEVLDTRGWDSLILRGIRKVRRRLGWADPRPGKLGTAMRRRLEATPLVVHTSLSLIMTARKSA